MAVIAVAVVVLFPVVVVAVLVVLVVLAVLVGTGDERVCDELHAALGAAAGCLADHLGMHRAHVGGGTLRRLHVHLRHECERLVGRRVDERRQALPFRDPLGVLPELAELLPERG